MADNDATESLEGLYKDLLAVSESRLAALDSVLAELEERIEAFKALLSHRQKSEASRNKLQSGSLQVDDEEFRVNAEFQQEVLKLADALDLDEVDAVRLYMLSEQEAQELDRSTFTCAIIRFHRRRLLLVECLRLTITQATDEDLDDAIRIPFRLLVQEIVGVRDGQIRNGPIYWDKCLSHITDIEKWLQALADRANSASVVGQYLDAEAHEILDYQRSSLTSQHQALATICAYMTQADLTVPKSLQNLIGTMRRLERHDIIQIHYIPILMSLISHFGSSDSRCTLEEARELHQFIVAGRDAGNWSSRGLHAATIIWWLAEYSGRYSDDSVTFQVPGVDLAQEAVARSSMFMECLRDGGFHFMLTSSQEVKSNEWYDPSKAGLITFLLGETAVPVPDPHSTSDYFQALYMEQQQGFVDAFITHMPDSLRRLKVEEDEQRKLLQSRFQQNNSEYELHLERFLILVCLAFEGYPLASQAFWNDPDSNLFGFLQWAAKRQTTPRVAAFCEMLRAISEGEVCAEAAHKFLLEESSVASGKMKRTSSLSWSQIVNEVEFYATRDKNRPMPMQAPIFAAERQGDDQIVERESGMMLETYLRLAAHLCRQSTVAREWVTFNPVFQLHEVLFQLLSSAIPTRLRACAFMTLSAILTSKTVSISETIWNSLDRWIFSDASPSNALPKAASVNAMAIRSDRYVFASINREFEEPNAFIGLIHSLMSPFSEDNFLNDTLPFPESLGSSYRTAGIDGYIDFAIGQIFADKSAELQDPIQLRLLRLNCLGFIATCLSTFNEDLVIFANRSTIPVDSVIGASSLTAYVQLHPFARTMEWLFNDKVIRALFQASHQDVKLVSDSAFDSPLVQSVMRSIEVMNLIMRLQSTYLDIVRPLLKSQPNSREPVANSALTSFEDSVLGHLNIVVDLGLFCGSGHQDLTLLSLSLLEKLSASRKLAVSPTSGFGNRSERSKIIGIIEAEGDADRIARSLVFDMQLDSRELSAGPEVAGYVIKESILAFLSTCLSAVASRPTIAHLLLGFTSEGLSLAIPDVGMFALGDSLFHAILKLALEYPETDGTSFISWQIALKQGCVQILEKLWQSPLSSPFVMAELRVCEYFFVLATRQISVEIDTLWEGRLLSDPEFLIAPSAMTLKKFLESRTSFFDYGARELRNSTQENLPALKARILGSLLGSTVVPSGERTPHLNIFDLFDFVELQIPDGVLPVDIRTLNDSDLELCRFGGADNSNLYDLRTAEELLHLRQNEMKGAGQLVTAADAQQFLAEAQSVLLLLQAQNQRHQIVQAQQQTLRAWVQLVSVALSTCDFDAGVRTAFILQSLQVIQPKIEAAYNEDEVIAIELTGLALTLIKGINFDDKEITGPASGSNDFAATRLVQLFRVALKGIFCPVSTSAPILRETCYQICYRYLRGIAAPSADNHDSNDQPSVQPCREIMRIIKLAGGQLLDATCDDAYSGEGTCQISALLFLEVLVATSIRAESSYVVDQFARLNFVLVLTETIKNVAQELRRSQPSAIPLLLSKNETTLALLLRIAQTRSGSSHVLNAGLFQAVHESRIFSADPDIGFEVDSATALRRFFALMLAVLRVINCVMLSRGPRNDQTKYLAQEFLRENRQSVVGVFKRNARLGAHDAVADEEMGELVDQFTLLVSATGFLELEEQEREERTTSYSVFS